MTLGEVIHSTLLSSWVNFFLYLLREYVFKRFYTSANLQKSFCLFGPFWLFSGCRKADKSPEKVWIRVRRRCPTLSDKFMTIVHLRSLYSMDIMKQKKKIARNSSSKCQMLSPSSTTTTTDRNKRDPNWRAGYHFVWPSEHTEIGKTHWWSLIRVEVNYQNILVRFWT